jgi:hypothetical protein
MFVWAPSRCPPFRPEALQPARAGHNDFGTVQEEGLVSAASMPKSSVHAIRVSPHSFRGAVSPLQHPYRKRRDRRKNGSHPQARFGLSKIRLVQPDNGNKKP